MDYGKGYVKELKTLNEEIKRLNIEKKNMQIEKKNTEMRLHDWMSRSHIDEYEGYKKEKLRPKEKQKFIRKKKKEKVEDAMRLFRNIGIPDPETFWLEFQGTQKNIPLEEDE